MAGLVGTLLLLAGPAWSGPVEAFLVGLYRTFGPAGLAACKAAANPLSHSARDCDNAYRLGETLAATAGSAADRGVEQGAEVLEGGFETAADCLADLAGCLETRGRDALQQLGAAGDDAFVTLTGRVTDDRGAPLAGVVVTAAPVGAPLPLAVASTHRAVSGPDGRWRIDINRYLAFNGPYRVTAAGLTHDFEGQAHAVTVGPP